MGSSENRICHLQNVMVHHGSSSFSPFFPCRPGRGRESSGRSAWPRCWKSWCLGHHAIYRLYELYIVVIWGHKPVINGISSLWGLASQGYLLVSHWDDHPSMSGVQKGTAIYWTLPRSSHRVCPKMMATFQKTLFFHEVVISRKVPQFLAVCYWYQRCTLWYLAVASDPRTSMPPVISYVCKS